MYTWKTYQELKNRVLRNKTQMLKDHLTTTADLLSRKLDQAKLDGDHDCHLTPAGDDSCDCQNYYERE